MIINLTPHAVVIGDRTIEPDGRVPRVGDHAVPNGDADGIPIRAVALGAVEGLPKPQDGVWYIVSRVVAEAMPSRRDLVIPYDLVRDDVGRVVGCRAFGQVPHRAAMLSALEIERERDRALGSGLVDMDIGNAVDTLASRLISALTDEDERDIVRRMRGMTPAT